MLNIAKQHRRHRAWALGPTLAPVPFIATGLSAALPHFGLTHVEPDRVAHDPDHDRVRVNPAAVPRVPFFLLELGAEYGRSRTIAQLQQLRLELRVRLVQQPLVDNEAWRAFPASGLIRFPKRSSSFPRTCCCGDFRF